MSELTVVALVARALLEFAVSKSGSCKVLAERSGIDPAALQTGDNRILFERYVAR